MFTIYNTKQVSLKVIFDENCIILNLGVVLTMHESSSSMPETKKVGVWAEGTHIEAKEFMIPKKSPDSSDDIPTIPDLDDLQDILEKEISIPPVSDLKDRETVSALSEVGGGISGTADSIEAVLEVLNSYIPEEEMDSADTVWTVDSLLQELAEDTQEPVL